MTCTTYAHIHSLTSHFGGVNWYGENIMLLLLHVLFFANIGYRACPSSFWKFLVCGYVGTSTTRCHVTITDHHYKLILRLAKVEARNSTSSLIARHILKHVSLTR